jgi:hypothetical protein
VRLEALVIAIVATGCVVPFAIPPLRGEIGSSTRIGRAGEAGSSSLHAAAGTHLASATRRRDQAFDVGIGGTYEQTATATSRGIYLDGAVFVDRTRRTRTSVGARGELRWLVDGLGERNAMAAKLRIDHEVYGGGTRAFSGDDACGAIAGAFSGTTAVGVFAEAGRVWSGMPEDDAWVATAGVSMRIPSAIGVYFGIPGCN